MYAISTAAFVYVLALASSLAVVVQAAGPRVQCSVASDVLKGETCHTFGTRLGLSQTAILSMNPGLSCQGTLTVGRLCISSSTPTCTHKVTATATTCDGLVSEWGLTRGVFYDYNDNVNKWCNNLVPGHAYCVRVG